MTVTVAHWDCQSCPVKIGADLCNIEGKEGAPFQNMKQTLMYRPGQVVFYEGHAVLGLYILCAGRVKLTRSSVDGQHRLVNIIDPGMLIEKQSFQDKAIHEVTCEVLESSQICVLDRSEYLGYLEKNGPLAVKVLKLLSREIGRSLIEVDQFAFATSRERLASLLLALSDRYGEPVPEGVRITLEFKREELAQMAAMTVETVVRLLKSFQMANLIRLRHREITLVQSHELRQMTQ